MTAVTLRHARADDAEAVFELLRALAHEVGEGDEFVGLLDLGFDAHEFVFTVDELVADVAEVFDAEHFRPAVAGFQLDQPAIGADAVLGMDEDPVAKDCMSRGPSSIATSPLCSLRRVRASLESYQIIECRPPRWMRGAAVKAQPTGALTVHTSREKPDTDSGM